MQTHTRAAYPPTTTRAASADLSECESCPIGWFQPDQVQEDCIGCVAGKFSTTASGIEATVCSDCAAGAFQLESGATDCVDCPAGQHQESEGAHGCVDCPTGHYQELASQAACDSCEPGLFQVQTGRSANRCSGPSPFCPHAPCAPCAPTNASTRMRAYGIHNKVATVHARTRAFSRR